MKLIKNKKSARSAKQQLIIIYCSHRFSTTKQTKMSSTKIFQDMLQANMPEHLVEHVAKQLHYILMKDVFQEIVMVYSHFELFFIENKNVFDIMEKLYPDITVHVHYYFDWITVVLKLTSTKFIMWHNYEEQAISETFLIEGEVEEKENVYTFSKFIYIDKGRHPKIIKDAEEYHNKKCKNMIPFQFLHSCMKNEHSIEYNVYKNAEKYSKWVFPNKIIDLFNAYPWEVPEDFADMMD